MPMIHIDLLEGRTPEQKQAFVDRVTEAAIEVLGSKPESVRIIIREMGPANYWVAGKPKAWNPGQGPGVPEAPSDH